MARGFGRIAVALCLTGLLAGCGIPPVARSASEADTDAVALAQACCRKPEVYPASAVRIYESKTTRHDLPDDPNRTRAPFLLEKPEAWAYVQRHLRPMDLLTTSDKGRSTSRLMPGYFSHSLIYIGTEAQLRAEGLWTHPALAPHHDRIRGGDVYFEAVPGKVGFGAEAEIFDVDAVAVHRPTLSHAEKRAGLTRMLAQLGKPFDRHFDSGKDDCIYCAELLDIAFPTLDLPHSTAYGRALVLPDRIAATALEDTGKLRLVGFVYGYPNGWASAKPEVLAATLKKHWPGG